MLRAVDVGEVTITKRDKLFKLHGMSLQHGAPSGQDAHIADAEHGCFAVADGVGSSLNSDVAARAVCDAYETATLRQYHQPSIMDRSSREYTRFVLDEVHAAALGALATTTFTGLTIHPDGVASYLHLGDSQLFLLRQDKLVRYTSEHVKPSGYELLNYLGTQPEWATIGYKRHELELTLQSNTFSRTKLEAEWGEIHLREGDRFALVTDGITGSHEYDRLHEWRLRQLLARKVGATACAALLLEQSRKIDDSTAIVVDIGWVED